MKNGSFIFSSASVICIDELGNVVLNRSVPFHEVVPNYYGYQENDDPSVRVADPLIWLDSLEILLQRCKEIDGFDFKAVRSLGGSAQQHGSVHSIHILCIYYLYTRWVLMQLFFKGLSEWRFSASEALGLGAKAI